MALELGKSPARTLFFILVVLIISLSTKALFFGEITSPSVRDFVDKETVMTGIISGEIVQRDSAQEVALKNIEVGGEIQNGKILVRLPKFQGFSTGDILEFRCRPVVPEPIDGFDYAAYLETRGVYAVCYRPEELAVQGKVAWGVADYLLLFRLAMIERLGKIFPEPHAAFMSGILFGGSQGLSQEMKGDFSRTGLSHVMAASGYNVSIFSRMLLVLLMRSVLGRRRAIIVSGLLVILYIFLAGATPPVIRAGIMAATAMLGVWLGRTPHAGNLLLFSACLMMIFNPNLIVDVGFQLSFGATAGLMLLGSWFGERIKFIPEIFGLRESCSASLAAISATLPIMLWHFGSTSLVAPLVNLLILPWIPYLMLLGGASLGVGWLSISLGAIVAVPASILSSFVLFLVTWFGSVSFASVSVPAAKSAAGLLFVFAVFFGLKIKKKNRVL